MNTIYVEIDFMYVNTMVCFSICRVRNIINYHVNFEFNLY